uniref:Uncharacterized protein n=1 Tax=Aegilops tauschii subsp. strangulata TaxID=200361 RepID=A0A453DA96_AEGTS
LLVSAFPLFRCLLKISPEEFIPACLSALQRFLNRTKPPLGKAQQQNLTRWAVLIAASLLKNNKAAHDALVSAMSQKATVLGCIEAIENAS